MLKRAAARSVLVFCLFFVICFALGYATLNRYDPSRTEGVGDSLWYFTMVETGIRSPDVTPPYRYRVLVPGLARLVHGVTRPLPLRSWNRTAFALLVVNSILVSLAALAIARVARLAFGAAGSVPLLAAFVYLTAYPIANGHLAGLVDAGEGLCLALVALVVMTRRWRWLPAVFVLAALAKESAVVLSVGFMAGVGWISRRSLREDRADHAAGYDGSRRFPAIGWFALAVAAAAACLVVVRVSVGGPSYEYHVASVRHVTQMPIEFLRCLASRSVVYTFIVTIPLTLLVWKRLPHPLVAGSIGAAVAAYLAGSYAAITENIARPLYNAIGPLVSIGAAVWLADGRRDGVEKR